MTHRTHAQQILTLPNLLSVVRIALIPWIVTSYLAGHDIASGLLLILSGLTDIADGWIARRWGAVSAIGKVLDPVADKLTLLCVLAMLLTACPAMTLVLIVLVIRETVMACTGLACVVCTKKVHSACWHGKVTTLLLYGTVFVHILWQEIPVAMSNSMIAICVLAQLLSLAMYTRDNISRIRRTKGGV